MAEKPVKRVVIRDNESVVDCDCHIIEYWKDGSKTKKSASTIERITCSHGHVVKYNYCQVCGVMIGMMEKLRPLPKRIQNVPTEQPWVSLS